MSARRPGEPSSPPASGRAPTLIPAQSFGKYTLVAKLGRGGMAEVFLAFVAGPAGFRKPLVIKRILPDLAAEPRLVDMFFDEARLAARLSHPHVVQTYEVGVIDGSHFLAMEYLEGQPLNQVLRQAMRDGSRMPEELIVRVMVDVLDGLHYAHELRDFDGSKLGVVHRDISPQNIFVTYDGVVKVLDFGIAKAATQVVETRTGAIKGKYAYMAPEQAKATEIDCRADVWGSGVVLWEALVGRRLFKADTDFATLEHTLRGPIPPLTEAVPGSSPVLGDVLERALVRNRDSRYATAQAMREDLEDYLRSHDKQASRTELAAYMRELFADVMTEHRALLRTCLTHVEDAVEHSHSTRSAPGSSRSGSGSAPPLVGKNDATVPGTPSRVKAQGSSSHSGVLLAPRQERSLGPLGLAILFVALAVIAGGIAMLVPLGPVRSEPLRDASRTTARTEAPEAPPAEPEWEAQPLPEATPPSEPIPTARVEPDPIEPGDTVPSDQTVAPDEHRPPVRDPRPPRNRPRPRPPTEEQAPDPAAVGRLFLNTTPWSQVYLRGRHLGDTPLRGVELPEGTHVVTLTNPEQQIEQTFRVVIQAGQDARYTVGIGN